MIGRIKHFLALCIIHICNQLPIKNNKVFLYSYYGAQFGCNPKYITNYILEHYPKETFDIVWAFNDPKQKEFSNHVRKVKTMSFKYFYELCTAKIIITNFRSTDLFIKRKDQYYIQTWHSSLRLKQIEKDAEDMLPSSYIDMAKKDSLKCDLLLSGCKYSSDIFKRSFWYDGEIFEYGTPRNDALLQNDSSVKEKILRNFNLPKESKILLYAPTFRKNNQSYVYDLNYTKLMEKLTEKLGGEWVIFVRLHPHLLLQSDKIIKGKDVIDVTSYDDIQELLVTADMLISDYSSLIFDYVITERPCFLYVPDYEEYRNKERDFYFTLDDLPFYSAKSNSDLLHLIENYQAEEYKKRVHLFLKMVGTFEKGQANAHLLKRMERICFGARKDEANEAI